jgi:hypothetical protein
MDVPRETRACIAATSAEEFAGCHSLAGGLVKADGEGVAEWALERCSSYSPIVFQL